MQPPCQVTRESHRAQGRNRVKENGCSVYGMRPEMECTVWGEWLKATAVGGMITKTS